MKKYDSKKDTEKHIKRVEKYLKACRLELVRRGVWKNTVDFLIEEV